jgi:hypothetical protein
MNKASKDRNLAFDEKIDVWAAGCIYAQLLRLCERQLNPQTPFFFPAWSCTTPPTSCKARRSAPSLLQLIFANLRAIFASLGHSKEAVHAVLQTQLSVYDPVVVAPHWALATQAPLAPLFSREQESRVRLLLALLHLDPRQRPAAQDVLALMPCCKKRARVEQDQEPPPLSRDARAWFESADMFDEKELCSKFDAFLAAYYRARTLHLLRGGARRLYANLRGSPAMCHVCRKQPALRACAHCARSVGDACCFHPCACCAAPLCQFCARGDYTAEFERWFCPACPRQ